MDPSAFDALTRSFQTAGSRRWLLRRLVASLPLLGALAVVGEEEVGAERPHERLARRTQQRNRKQRNRKQRTTTTITITATTTITITMAAVVVAAVTAAVAVVVTSAPARRATFA